MKSSLIVISSSVELARLLLIDLDLLRGKRERRGVAGNISILYSSAARLSPEYEDKVLGEYSLFAGVCRD